MAPMRFKGFIGPSYTLASVNYDCQRCINLYPEMDEIYTGKDGEIMSLVGTPGLSLLSAIGTGPIRAMYYTTTGIFLVVSGNTIYSVSSAWAGTSLGTLLTSKGPVQIFDNGIQAFLVDGTNGYYITLPSGSVTQVTDANWLGSNAITYQDGYFIFAQPNTNKFYLSDLNAVTFVAPAITSKEGNPDNIISILSVNSQLWLLGDRTSEVFFNSGDNLNPFQRIPGSLMQYGCASPYAVATMANTIFWLAKDATGNGLVVMANGFIPQRISTHAVERAIQGYSSISDALAWTYQENGHQFLVLTFPTGNATWVYDIATQLWHERAYLNAGVLQRHRANCYAYAFGNHVVGDYSNGNVYQQSLTYYTDNGDAIQRQRVSPHISNQDSWLFYSRFQLDMETGVGIDGTGQGTNPQAILQWSDDGGHTWSNEHWVSIGAIGTTTTRAIWRRLGKARNRVFKVTISDPVKNVWIGADLDFEAGAA